MASWQLHVVVIALKASQAEMMGDNIVADGCELPPADDVRHALRELDAWRRSTRGRTTEELIAAAERLFVAGGFHATSLEQIAAAAGYTKGAVYSNFESKDELFLAVYERRVERALAELERAFDQLGPLAGLEWLAAQTAGRRGREDQDGWLAVFFEFWAHIVRQPASRQRFAEIHARVQAPVAAAGRRYAAERGMRLPEGAAAFNVAMSAMQLGLALERLTQPDVVDAELGARMMRFVLERLDRDGDTTDGRIGKRC